MAILRKNIESEEGQEPPQLESTLVTEDSNKAAVSFQRTKKFVPTRSHPPAPNTPVAETLAGFLAFPMDKLKDMFAKFPTEEMKDNAKNQ